MEVAQIKTFFAGERAALMRGCPERARSSARAESPSQRGSWCPVQTTNKQAWKPKWILKMKTELKIFIYTETFYTIDLDNKWVFKHSVLLTALYIGQLWSVIVKAYLLTLNFYNKHNRDPNELNQWSNMLYNFTTSSAHAGLVKETLNLWMIILDSRTVSL